jgi:hypothetical protein
MPDENPIAAVPIKKEEFKYWAFISYSHRDAAWAEWLHRSLEHYYVPGSLVGRPSRNGPLPPRLIPVFRDRDELSAAHDLGLYIKSSLALSRHLVVICSRNSVKSKYVDGEIRYYKSLGREDRVLCLIVDGEPDCGDPARECFPEAVRFLVGPDEKILTERASPIASDARPAGDGKSNALVKLLAGILGVKYDELRQRERRRRIRQGFERAALMALILAFFFGLWRYEEDSKREQQVAEYLHAAAQAEGNGTLKQACRYLAEAGDLVSESERSAPDFTKEFRHAARGLVAENKILKGHSNWVCHCVFSPDGKELLTTSWDSTIRRWDMTGSGTISSQPIHTFKENSSDVFLCANYSPDGSEIACSTWWSALAWVTDCDGDLIGRMIDDHRGRVNYVAYSADGTRIVTASDDCTARIWDARGYSVRIFAGHTAGVKTAMFNQSGMRLLTASFDGTAKVWDAATGEALRTVGVKGGDGLNCADFSPDGETFVTAGLDGRARIWSTTTAGNPLVFHEHHGRINSAMFSHHGDLVVTAADDGTAKVWRAKTGALVLSLEGHEGPVLWAAFSADDSLVATAGKDRTVRIWKLADAPPEDLSWSDFTARVRSFHLDAQAGSE